MERQQAGFYCGGAGEKWSDPGSKLKVEMPGFRDGWEDVRKAGEAPGMKEGPST